MVQKNVFVGLMFIAASLAFMRHRAKVIMKFAKEYPHGDIVKNQPIKSDARQLGKGAK